jgi:uncharacterized protein
MSLFEPNVIAVVALAFLGGGLVKGVLGIGLPLIAVPIMTFLMPLPTALAVLAVPMITSNLQQLTQAGQLREAVARFRWLLMTIPVGVLLSVQALVRVSPHAMNIVIGILLALFVLVALRPDLGSPRRESEAWLSPAVGLGAGLIGGVSSFLGPPVSAYLVALRVPKDLFITVTAAAFLAGGIPLQLSLAAYSVLGWNELIMSLGAVLPVSLGVWLGERLRRRIVQEAFRRAVLTLLAVIAASLIWKGLG